MKRFGLVLLSVFLCASFVEAQSTQAKKTEVRPVGQAAAKFDKTTHDYGRIAEEVGTAVCEFEFTNTGDKPLIINRVSASCGCTTPSYTKEPVLPGQKGTIKVAYSTTGRVGSFSKTVRVLTNTPEGQYVLVIKGEVLPRKK